MIYFFAMQALDCDLAEMLFHAEVHQLIVLDATISIVVIPKDVFYEIVHFRAIFS